MRILEEFWYRNIDPTDYDTSSSTEYKKLLELICRNEEKLQATMTDEQKELFSRYTDAVHEHQMTTDCLVCTRLRHVAGTQWGCKKYMNMKHLEAVLDDAFIAG